MPKPAAPTATLTVYELKEVHGVSSFATGGGTRHKGMPVRKGNSVIVIDERNAKLWTS
jgi:hypothetical protein